MKNFNFFGDSWSKKGELGQFPDLREGMLFRGVDNPKSTLWIYIMF